MRQEILSFFIRYEDKKRPTDLPVSQCFFLNLCTKIPFVLSVYVARYISSAQSDRPYQCQPTPRQHSTSPYSHRSHVSPAGYASSKSSDRQCQPSPCTAPALSGLRTLNVIRQIQNMTPVYQRHQAMPAALSRASSQHSTPSTCAACLLNHLTEYGNLRAAGL